MADERDAVKALAIYGDASLANVKAFLLEHGFTLPDDGKEARIWCEGRAIAGDTQACYVAAQMFHLGLFGPIDQQRALELCNVASEAGVAPALLLLASIVEHQDERKALALMEESAKKGYAPAMYAVALKYMVDGISQSDKELGLQYLKLAARHSFAPAQTTLAAHLLEAGGEDEIQESIGLMQEAAEQRSPHAHRMLAHWFQAGRYGFQADAAKASELRAEAARIEAESLLTWGLRT
jgi:TPR repeat protein